MEASKEGELPSEPAPETLPTEMKEERKKFPMLLAVIIVVIIIVAAIGAAFGLGLIGKKKHVNEPPVGGAKAVTDTTIDIGQSVTFNSTASDPDGRITNITWLFGDGVTVSGTPAQVSNVTHAYTYGGTYWVYQTVKDDGGAEGSNEASMIRVIVRVYDPATIAFWDNATAPFALLGSDVDVITANTTVNFNMTGSYGVGGWNWVNASNHDEGQNLYSGVANITYAKLDFGDGSPFAVTSTAGDIMTSSHKYTTSGHYAAKFTVYSINANPYKSTNVSTTVMRTIHVLTSGTPGAVKNPNAVIFATIGEPDYVDPAVDYETAGGEVLQNVYETLVWYDKNSAVNLIPMLATTVPTVANGGITADGLNYTFTVRQGVKFHTGETMTTEDVAFSLQRVLRIHDPNGPSWMMEQVQNDYISYYVGDELQNFTASVTTHTIPAWLLNAIGGTAPTYKITEQDVTNTSLAAITSTSTTVTVRLTHPYPGFIYIMAYTVASIVSKAYVNANGGVVNGDHNIHMDSNTDGTGPYKMVEWTKGSRIHMTKNVDYWGTKASINDVYIVLATDVNTRILMLQSGDADFADMPIDFRSLFTGANFRISQGNATFDITFAGFNFDINTTEAAKFGSDVPADFFTNVHLRRAFVHLMDYTLFIQSVLQSNARQPNGPIPLGMPGYTPQVPNYTYDLALAETEFKAAINTATGNSWWDDGFSIAFMFNAGNTYRETACTYMKTALEGLNTKFHASVNALDWPTYLRLQRASPSPLPMFWLGWAPDYVDPDDYVTPFLDSVFGTYAAKTGYQNTSLDALIRQAGSELNAAARARLYGEITWACHNDTPYVWLWQSNNFHVERSWIHGYYYNPMYSAFYYAQFTKGGT